MEQAEKDKIEQIRVSVEQFKDLHTRELNELKEKGFASAETLQAVERSNAKISDLQGDLTAIRAAIREMENDGARLSNVAATVSTDERTAARGFVARMTKRPASLIRDVTDEQLATVRAYNAAFEDFLKNGRDGMSAESLQAVRNTMQTTNDPKGGFLVSPDRTGPMVKLIYESTPMRQLATVKTTSKNRIEGGLDLDEVEAGWVGETETRAVTETQKYGRYDIVLGELYAQPDFTQTMLDDADIDVWAETEQKAAEAFSRKANTAFVSGAGIKTPRGFLTYAAGANSKTSYGKIQQISTGVSAGFPVRTGEVNGADVFHDTVASMKSALRVPDCQWLMARLTAAAARKLKDGQGNYLWSPEFAKSPGGTILGYGVTEGEDMPAIAANSLSVAFANWKAGYVIYDHVTGYRLLRDPYTKKGYVIMYLTTRVGGDVLDFDAIKLIKFG